jgi:aspartyl/asparaginyl beta-hydroxylase (cupin superfamily)
MKKYNNNIHISKTEMSVLSEIMSDYVNNTIDCKDPQKISNLIRINAIARLCIKIFTKDYLNKGYMMPDWEYIIKNWKIKMIRTNRDKLLEIQSKHIILTEYKDLHHFNSYEKLKVELPDGN